MRFRIYFAPGACVCIIALLCFTYLRCGCSAPNSHLREMQDYYCELQLPDGTCVGSAVLVNTWRGTRAITAHHCVDPAGEGSRWLLVNRQFRGIEFRYTATVERVDKGNDLASLKLDAENIRGVDLLPDTPVIGEDVYAVGTPDGNYGFVNRSVLHGHKDSTYYFGGECWFGNSGGPLYVVRSGKPHLIGIVQMLYIPDSPWGPCKLWNLACDLPTLRRFINGG